MNFELLEPRAALNKAFRKVKPNRADFETFRAQLDTLLAGVKAGESEEFHKNLIADFLKKSTYDAHAINTKERNDLVIHEGKTSDTPVAVILETKKPDNKSEMPTAADLNRKALHELTLYYLRERVTNKNLNVKHLIVTNTYEWFIFDANVFEKAFVKHKAFVKSFEAFEAGRLAGSKTEFFYNDIAKPFIAELAEPLSFTYVDLRDYQLATDEAGEKRLITLYKLFSPEHLLKLPFANDSNTLDKTFYAELLHIIGLTETKVNGKKLIVRQDETRRGDASLLENTIIQLTDRDKLSRLNDPQNYGGTREERLFNVALELSITWINRVLFLKLLESQLKTYHRNDADIGFLNANRLHNYDDLNTLFFGVLARPVDERSASVGEFERVPYLNSSLFELSELEHRTLDMSALRDERELPLYAGTVLKDAQGKRRTGSLGTLSYLFEFLDAYDFSSEGTETVQEERKTLINASVLGLIFEKINGYKDGSFFTPGFITMYMCRETVRRAVVQKFNEVKGWHCGTFDELYDKIDDKREANAIINSVKVCDPAVGSGHFLVSALNELLSIKSELKVLLDEKGKTLRDYALEVSNDELVISDSDGELFAYNPKNAESQRVQKTLFLEKQTLIENCLFGVDINPNSIKICRLRLWIELLKHAYYKPDGQLETLPNIDINIKTGNSLISRFALDADLKQALKKSDHTIESYQNAVNTYRNASSKEEKREMERLIGRIKSGFRTEIANNDLKVIRLGNLRVKQATLEQSQLFEEMAAQKKEREKLSQDIDKLSAEIEAVRSNKIFENAFEWRFEFPEVLDDNGDFTGFDVVIGNPPYVLISKREFDKGYSEFFPLMSGKPDLYRMFVEKCIELLVPNGFMSLIIPNTILTIPSASKLRQYFLENISLGKIVNFGDSVFEEASVNSIVLDAKKSKPVQRNTVGVYQNPSLSLGGVSFDEWFSANQDDWLKNKRYEWNIFVTSETTKILDNVMKVSKELDTFTDNLSLGIQVYHNSIHIQEEIKSRYLHADHEVDKNHILELGGKNLSRFAVKESKKPVYVDYSSDKIYMRVEPSIFRQKRILLREIVADRLVATLTDAKFAVNKSCYIITLNKDAVSYEYVLGILNSTLIGFWVSNKGDKANQKLFPRITMSTLRTLPIRTINFSDPADTQKHDAVVGLVETMLSLHEQRAVADPSERARLEREIAAADAQIDALVYGLYELTGEEIRIVEEAVAR